MAQRERVRVIRADRALKRKLDSSAPLNTFFTPQVLRDTERRVILQHREEFFKSTRVDVQRLRGAWRNLLQDRERAVPRHAQELAHIAFDLRNRAATFGFRLGAAIAGSLELYVEKLQRARPEQRIVVEAHLDALAALFRDKDEEEGGIKGRQLLLALRKLAQKYKP